MPVSDNDDAEARSLAQSLRIETLDRSGRWYLTPGSRCIYDLRVRNDTKNAADCSLVVEDPASGVTVDPPTFTLRGHEVRTVTVLFSENANPTRGQRVLMTLRDDSGAELATFEHPLIVTGGTDCSITLLFKDVIVEKGELWGFSMAAAIRSQSEAPSTFQISFTSHPAFSVANLPLLQLEPGQSGEVNIPVRWDRSIKDSSGLNHPRMLEVWVPVSNGKRTTRIRWDIIDEKLQTAAQKIAATVKAASVALRTPTPPRRVAVEKPLVPLLMLNGHVALKFLPNPLAPASGSEINAAATASIATPAVSREATALSLFPDLGASVAQPLTPSSNGKKVELSAPATTLAAAAAPVAPPPPTPAPPAISVAAPQAPPTAPATPSAPTESVVSGPKLTPYSPARFGAEVKTSTAVAKPLPQAQPAQPQDISIVPPMTIAAATVRSRKAVPSQPRKWGVPTGIVIGGLAVASIAVAAILFKPASLTTKTPATTSAVAVATPMVGLNQTAPTQAAQPPVTHKILAAPHVKPKTVAATPAARPTATAQPTPATTAQPSTPRPATPRPATPKPIAAAPPQHKATPARGATVRQQQLYQPASGSVVALGGIEAFYGPRGHAVRVLWSAAEQASASVALIDEHGTTVSSTFVHGSRQSALLYLPRRFHGFLTVQVSSVGRLGERVAQTTSLPAFGT